MLGLLILRIYWGIAGSSTARFAHFVGGPRAVLEHLRQRREERARIVGHSPLGSWSVLAMLLALIALHVVAILFYLLYERNNLVTAMLSGRKRVAGEPPGMRPAPGWRLWTGVALATLVVWMIVAG